MPDNLPAITTHRAPASSVTDAKWFGGPNRHAMAAAMEVDVLLVARGRWPTTFPVDQVLGYMNHQATYKLGWSSPPSDKLDHEQEHLDPADTHAKNVEVVASRPSDNIEPGSHADMENPFNNSAREYDLNHPTVDEWAGDQP